MLIHVWNGENIKVLVICLFTGIHVFSHVWNMWNWRKWIGSSCMFIHWYSRVDARVEQVKQVRFWLYVFSREFTCLYKCETSEAGTVLAASVYTCLCTCGTRKTCTVLAVRVFT